MQGLAVVLVLVLIPLSALTIATRRQSVTAGSGRIVRAKKRSSFIATFWRWVRLVKGRVMTQGETVTIGRASLDAVVRERDNAVIQLAALRTEQAGAFARDAAEVRQAIKDRDVMIDKLREDNAQLREDNQRIGTIAAQFAGAKDVTKLTVIDRVELERLRALQSVIDDVATALAPYYNEAST